MKVQETSLPGVLLLESPVFSDQRGFFKETWNRKAFAKSGLDLEFVQDNLSFSRRGILRGLHFQNPSPQGKLVQVLLGEVFDVAVDIRTGSPTFGQWFGTMLSQENNLQMFVPEGFAHGFCVTGESALLSYKCTDFYDPGAEFSLRYDDPDIGIQWPMEHPPTLSAKDQKAALLRDFPGESLPAYTRP